MRILFTLKGLETIMGLSIAESFNFPVDLDAYPDYARIVPYPIDLNTIKERLENRYYRRLTALKSDVHLIEINDELFNEPGSKIVFNGKLLTRLLFEFIDNTGCTNPMPIYKRLCHDEATACRLD